MSFEICTQMIRVQTRIVFSYPGANKSLNINTLYHIFYMHPDKYIKTNKLYRVLKEAIYKPFHTCILLLLSCRVQWVQTGATAFKYL
jgi:hypothetical protein